MSDTRSPSGCCESDCCPDSATPPATEVLDATDVRTTVREKYGAIAEGEKPGCCVGGCCSGTTEVLDAIGYTAEQMAAIPADTNLGLGCGSPLAFAEVKPGDTVLDLGSGAGIDCFLASRATGSAGSVIGVDMTPAMIEKARANAAKHGFVNVEFRLGEIEHLPVADASVDLIISNCVVNLSPDKPRVFHEAHRVLRPGGHLMVSDLVLLRPLTPEMQKSVDLYVGCVAGASLREEYLEQLRQAGFAAVEVVKENRYEVGVSELPPDSPERAAFDSVVSITVQARKSA